MWQRVLSFFGWLWAGFFILIGLASFIENPAFALTSIIWGLIFLPPLFRLTSRYGLGWNIGGRVLVFFISTVIFGILSPPEPQVTQSEPPVKTTPAGINTADSPEITSTPSFTPIAKPTPTLETTSFPEAPKPEVTVVPVRPQQTPTLEAIEPSNPEPPQNVPEPIREPAAQPQTNPNAPVRAAVSGSCDCPYDTDRRGRSCGKRSAYSRPGGRSPVCYVRD